MLGVVMTVIEKEILTDEVLINFCRKWHIDELSIFGSALRTDFGPESDLDILVSFGGGARWSLFDLIEMEDELAGISAREVDLVEKEGLRNPFRRSEILNNRKVIYKAR
jgi:predicted nucleotidyltransferase